jgi:hypothetical protein
MTRPDPLDRVRTRWPLAEAVRVPAQWADGETWVVVDVGRLQGLGGLVTVETFRGAEVGPRRKTREAAIRAAAEAA